MKQIMITILGGDKAGIISKTTGILFKRKCNLEDISMTILEGEFAMILVATMTPTHIALVSKELEEFSKKEKLTIHLKALSQKLKRGEKHKRGTQSHIVTACGKDKSGIVHEVSKMLAKKKLNITDLHSRILGTGKKSVYIMMLETDIPRSFNTRGLKQAFARLAKRLKVEINLRPLETIEG